MLGRTYTSNPNAETAEKWEGRTVSFNGSDKTAKVLRAYWQGPGKAVQLRVADLDEEGFLVADRLTDSEHVVIVRD